MTIAANHIQLNQKYQSQQTHTHSGTHLHTHLQQRHCTPANFFNLLGPSRAIYSSLHTRIRTQVRPSPSQLKSCSWCWCWCCSDPIWSNLSLGSSSVLFFNKLIYGPWLITERQLGSAQFAWASSLLLCYQHTRATYNYIHVHTQLHTDTLDHAHVVVCLLLSSGIQLLLIRGHLTLSLLSPRSDMIVCQAESELINKYEP